MHSTSEHGVSSITTITTADAHTSAASSRLNCPPPRQFKWTRPLRRKTKSGFCACAITFQTCSTIAVADIGGKVSSLLGTFTLISGVLLPLSARECIFVNSKYILCSLCSYSSEKPVLGAQEQNAVICLNKASLF